MGVNKNILAASVSSYVCGIIFDPLAEENIEVGDAAGDGQRVHHADEPADMQDTHAFHLGSCGLILDYLL